MHYQSQDQTRSTSNRVLRRLASLADFGMESSCPSPSLSASSTRMSGSTRRITLAGGMILDSLSEPHHLWEDQVPRQANEPEASNKSVDHISHSSRCEKNGHRNVAPKGENIMIKSIAIWTAIAATMLSNCLGNDSTALMDEMKSLNTQIQDAEHILKTMEEAAREENPLIARAEEEFARARKLENSVPNVGKYLHNDKALAKDRQRKFGRLKHAYTLVFVIEMLESEDELTQACFTCSDVLMGMYISHMSQPLQIKMDNSKEAPMKEQWAEFKSKAIPKKRELQEYYSKVKESAGVPPEVLKGAENNAKSGFLVEMFYSSYINISTPEAVQKQRGDVNTLKRRRAHLDIEIEEANKEGAGGHV